MGLFLTMGVYVSVLGRKRINKCAFVLSVLLSFGMGIQGVRGILVLYGPLFGMEAIRNLYRLYCREKAEKTDIFVSIWVTALLLLSFAGTLFPVSIGQDISRNIRKGFQKLFTEVIPNMGVAIGLEAANPAEKAALIILLLTVLYLVLNILWRMCRKEKIEATEWAFLVICASPVITALMMAFTTFEMTERYGFLLTYVMAFAVVLMLGRLRGKENGRLRMAGSLLVSLSAAVIVVSNLNSVYVPIMKAERIPQTSEYEVAKYLVENDFRIGYSNFYHANALTVLSNGRIRCAAVESLEKMNVCKWLTSSRWYVPNVPYEERTAYIVSEAQMDDFAKFLTTHEDDMKFETQIGDYSIYSSDYNFSYLEY